MASIPRFQQRKLASELVGVPAADRSTEILAKAVGTSAKQIGDVFTRFKILDNKRKAANDDSRIALETVKLSSSLDQLDREFKLNNSGSPRGREQEYFELLNDRVRETVDTFDNKNISSKVLKFGTNETLKKGLQFNQWASEQEVSNGFDNLNETQDLLVDQVNLTDDPNVFIESLNKMQNNLIASKQFLQTKEQQKFVENSPKSIAISYINGQLDRAPDKILNELQSEALRPVFTNILGSKEVSGFIDSARTKTGKMKEMADTNRLIEADRNFTELYDEFLAGKSIITKVDLLEKEGRLDERTAALLKEREIKSIPTNVKADVQWNLWKRQAAISQQVKNNSLNQNFEELVNFANEVMEARNRGNITVSKEIDFLKPIYDALKQSIKGENGNIGFGKNVFEVVTEEIQGFAKNVGREGDIVFMTDVLSDFMMTSGKEDFSKRIPGKERREVEDLLKESIDAVLNSENPGNSLSAGDANRTITADGSDLRSLRIQKPTGKSDVAIDRSRFVVQRNKNTGEFRIFDKLENRSRAATKAEIEALS